MAAKILVVEDNLDTRAATHLYLKAEGFEVVTAYDGREGLYMARAERPDLIVTDLNMPNLDGLALVKELRADKELKDTPIIIVTAMSHEERDDAIRAGADRAIDKPILFESLIEDINELLKERKRQDR